MFKCNKNYVRVSSIDTSYEPTTFVVEYPENKLPELFVVGASNKCDCVVVTSDLYDLFNQQRIENLGVDVARDFLARYLPSNSVYSDAISKLSDDAILESIKPRNIQTYSDLMQWSQWLQMRIDQGLAPEDTDEDNSEDTHEDNSSDTHVENSANEPIVNS